MQAHNSRTHPDIRIVRKRIKNMYLRIYPDASVVVSAPLSTPDADIQGFIESKSRWITEKITQQVQRQSRQSMSSLNAELPSSFQLWGETYPLKYRLGKRNCFDWQDNAGVVTRRENTTREQYSALIIEFYRRCIEERVASYVEAYQPIVGVDVCEVRTKRMKTRWGTCNIPAKRLWFNVYLAQFPVRCTEYVVVHEMTHLLERYHNRRFYQLVEEAMPDWKRWHQYLKNAVL